LTTTGMGAIIQIVLISY